MSADHEQDPSGAALREATITAVRWISLARIAVEVLALAQAVVLARLIPPADFGRAAIALILVGLASTLLGGMLSPRLVQRRDISPAYSEVVAWVSLVGGGVLAGVAALAGPILGRALLDADTGELMLIASPTFLLAGLAVTPQALRQRRVDFRDLSIIEIGATLVGVTTAVALAIAGLDGKALILGVLAGQVTSTAALLAAGPRVRPRFHRRELRDILSFGVPAGLGSLGYLTFRNVDYVIVGARLGAAPLGAYWRAYQLGVEYQKKISVVMLKVAFPVYSRTRDLAEMRAMRTRIVRMHAAVIFPLLALLIALAPQLIPFLFGPNWDAAVVPAQILALGGMATAVQTGIGPLMLAIGRTRALLALTWAALATYTATVYVVAPLGIVAVSIAVICVGFASLTAGQLLLRRYAGIPLRSMVGETGGAICGSAALVAAAYPLGRMLSEAGVSDGIAAAGAGTVGLALYMLVLRAVAPSAWSDVVLVARRVAGRAPRLPAPVAAGS